MESTLKDLAGDHRSIEAALDRFGESLASRRLDTALFEEIREAIAEHYRREEQFLARLQAHEPALAAKLQAQHEEVLEIAAGLEEALTTGDPGDIGYLARRFLAIAQHNMIEEERDVFPLAERCFSAEGAPPS